MTRKQLVDAIRQKQSYLCIGLDTDSGKIPNHLLAHADPVFEFNKRIIDATKDFCIAYKVNTAFYEALGMPGWAAMEKTVDYIPSTHFKIADAKRGDIGNSSAQYAKAFFKTLHFDAITVAPYMGEDSLRPFLEYEDKWAIVLGLTSNAGARDFELQKSGDEFLYEKVIRTVSRWGTTENTMFVVGATQTGQFEKIRKLAPNHFYLVPGVGTQGGSLREISEKGLNKDFGLLVNVSRDVIYASADKEFDQKAAEKARQYQQEMMSLLNIRVNS
jgi:orotidine-5'-phosphate decarboxylase